MITARDDVNIMELDALMANDVIYDGSRVAPPPPLPLNPTTTLGLFLSPAILIYSLKSKFFSLDGFVSTVAVLEKFHFIVILRSKIFVITSALKLQAPPKRKRLLLLK